MQFNYINVKTFLVTKQFLKKGDYLYENVNNQAPIQKDYDISKLYFVIDYNGHNLTIQNMSNNTTMTVDLTLLNDNWFVLPIPPNVRKQIGLD